MYILIPILFVLILYALSLRGRRNHPGMDALRGWSYAHRGLHKPGMPENSMAAFQAALDQGYGIELDIHLLKDGHLAVIHDYNLLRTAGMDVQIEDLTAEQLKQYHLEDTDQVIPTFKQVLDLFDGKAPMIVELKTTKNNYAPLTDAAVALLRQYNGVYCIESFDPRCILYLRKHHPDIIRGQLVENFLNSKVSVPRLLKLFLTLQLANFLILPDFVAHRFEERKNISNILTRRLWGVQGVSWTLRTPEDYETAKSEGYLPIFEGFEP